MARPWARELGSVCEKSQVIHKNNFRDSSLANCRDSSRRDHHVTTLSCQSKRVDPNIFINDPFAAFHEEPSVVVLVWHTDSNTLTLIKEFAPGREEVSYGVVAGMYERNKHDSPLQAAKYELEEEAHLLGGTWHALCDDADTTVNADKYSNNEFYCWLVVDPHVTATPRALDDEESIEIQRGITMKQATRMLTGGKLSIVSSFTLLMGARKLRELGLDVVDSLGPRVGGGAVGQNGNIER
eukprot:jgi/Undpi1/7190/HiC_scaffold_22.g09664.m1